MGTKGKGIVLGKERSESIEDLRPSADKNKDVKNTTMKGSEGEVAIRRTKEMTLTDERERKKKSGLRMVKKMRRFMRK